MNIKDAQRDRIVQMLSLGTGTATEQGASGNQWKVLVFDKFGQDTIAPLMKVGALRNQGVTLHLQLHAARQAVPNVAAVYFVDPSEENIRRIIEDIAKEMYSPLYVNFTSAISSATLEEFAKGVASVMKGSSPIAQVVDRYVHFISLAPTVCSLNLEQSYFRLNSASQSESAINDFIERCAVGIVSAVTTLGVVPVIRAAAGGAAEMIARNVDGKLRELLQSSTSLAQQLSQGQVKGSDGSRPVLIIVDRDLDLLSMLAHTWNYQAMIHDVLHMKLNAVRVVNEKNETVQYDVDTSDTFFAANRYQPFHDVGTAVHAEIENYAKQRQGMNQADDNFAAIGHALNSLSHMSEKKRSIDMHTNLATALLEEIKARGIDKFYQLENQWSLGGYTTNTAISDLRGLLTGDKGTAKDKARALMVLYLSKPDIPSTTIDALTQEFAAKDVDISGLDVLKHSLSVKAMASPRAAPPQPIVPAVQLPSFVPSNIQTMAQGLSKTAGGLLVTGMNQLQAIAASRKVLPIETVVQSMMDNKETSHPLTEKYLYIDPKTTQREIRMRSAFSNAIVFTIGGGNFVESEALDMFAQKTNRSIVYGATDIVSPEDFVDQLCQLSR